MEQQFVKEITKKGKKYKAMRQSMKPSLDLNQKKVTVGIYTGPIEKQMSGVFLCYFAFKKSTSVIFTFFQYQDIDDKTCQVFCGWIKN